MSKSRKPSEQRLLLLDIDNVLFDRDAYLEDVNKALMLNAGVGKEEFEEAIDSYYEKIKMVRNFDPVGYARFLATRFQVAYSPLEKIATDIDRARRGKYYDTYESVDLLSRLFELGIFSEGHLEYQRMKLKSLSLSLFLNPKHIYILMNKLDNELIDQLPMGTLIADDRLKVVEFLDQFSNITPILVDRKKLYLDFDGLYCTSLEEMYKMLKKKFGREKKD